MSFRADLRFDYGGHELPAINSEESFTVETAPNSWELNRIHRQPERGGIIINSSPTQPFTSEAHWHKPSVWDIRIARPRASIRFSYVLRSAIHPGGL